MDVAMALATVFFCLLLLASAAISLLLLRLCLAALRRAPAPAPYAAVDPEAAARAAPPPVPQQEPKAPEPRRLAWREVEALTGGFDEAAVVGRGGSGGAVYLSRIPVVTGGPPAAVKVHRWCGGGERRLGAFRRELDLLRRVGRHPRLVALLAYSDDHEEGGALVLEYMPGGTLADRLHHAATPPLTWRRRMRVLHDVAAALEHLHDAVSVVHGDVSASNVLLDGGGRARLCDLGSACEGTFSAAVAPARGAAAVGSPGYADPFFLRTGIVSKKSDVYGFGVLLLEALTGSPAAGAPRPDGSCQYLAARVLPRLRSAGVAGLVDGRLGGEYDAVEAGDVARIAVECVAPQPGLRPTMAQVRAAVAEKAARSIAATTTDGGDGDLKLLDLFRMAS
ncbi:salt tolerance receptor-like cytoplasmic kinase 1 [Triticum dicoccoides]|uniref:salt tolerance receptor-like cytoplasmic kinase 1 n=1 Tax=Triticum dicoccoides TaxID=85692 RepID=UPI000E7A064E|nr:salt tolerance receptor-like cytoplasmic kinase 1 [Triticum dicoccoides]